MAYVCLYVYIFFSGLGRYSLVVLVHSGDRPARQGQGRKHFANLQRYFAISKRYFAIFEKIFRNFRKDILQFCKDIPQFSQRYSAILQRYFAILQRYSTIFVKIFCNFRKDIPQFSLNESRPGRRSVIYIYPVMNPNTFPS